MLIRVPIERLPLEYEAHEDTLLAVVLVCYKGNFCAIASPSPPAARAMLCVLCRPHHSSAVIQVCEWLFAFILIDRQIENELVYRNEREVSYICVRPINRSDIPEGPYVVSMEVIRS